MNRPPQNKERKNTKISLWCEKGLFLFLLLKEVAVVVMMEVLEEKVEEELKEVQEEEGENIAKAS